MNYYNEIKNELINNEINRKVKNYAINKSDLNSYYHVGKILSEAGKHYGEGIIKEYSKKLKDDLDKNYSVRLLYRILKYYNFVSSEKLPTMSAKLSWSHYDEILKFDDINKIKYYIKTVFSFIKSEYPIKLDNRYNHINLLLYNIEFNCYVVIELKVTELKKEHIGQIQVYMNYIDNNLKKINQEKTIGIIICKQNNNYVIKYCSDNRIISREYELI